MLRLSSLITLTDPVTGNQLAFDFVNETTIKTTWKNFTSTAKIVLPRKLMVGTQKLSDIIKIGYKVNIQLGYNDNLTNEFTGYVSRLEPNVPFVLNCEDEMWNLKQNSWSLSYKSATLKQIVAAIAPGFTVNVLDTDPFPFAINQLSTAKALEDLKKLGFTSYFQNGVLNVGFVYSKTPVNVVYDFYKNVISNDLEYRSAADAKVRVVVRSLQSNNKYLKAEVGDKGGELRAFSMPGMTQKQITDQANFFLSQVKIEGWKGSITTFGLPVCQHGDIANITDEDYPERTGSYFIDEVETSFGVKGFRRKVALGGRAAA